MKIKKILIYLFAVGAVVLLIKNASNAIRYASDAIDLCLEMIVPTLFPFFICSGILIYSGFCELLAKAFQFCMYPLFRISPVGSSAFILGIVSGYPLGAVTAGELYSNNYLSKTEAERLLAFCNNSGPLFNTHFIVNSVNFEDGHKLQWSSADLRELKERCNAQSQEQGLHVPEKGKTFEGAEREETVAWSKDTYQLLKQAEQGKVKSYVQDIALAVLDSKEIATSRETFIRLMNERGYGVDWQDSHKYITYTDLAREQAGEKACKIRNNKLEKYYNMGFGKEELEHEFERNARDRKSVV